MCKPGLPKPAATCSRTASCCSQQRQWAYLRRRRARWRSPPAAQRLPPPAAHPAPTASHDARLPGGGRPPRRAWPRRRALRAGGPAVSHALPLLPRSRAGQGRMAAAGCDRLPCGLYMCRHPAREPRQRASQPLNRSTFRPSPPQPLPAAPHLSSRLGGTAGCIPPGLEPP